MVWNSDRSAIFVEKHPSPLEAAQSVISKKIKLTMRRNATAQKRRLSKRVL